VFNKLEKRGKICKEGVPGAGRKRGKRFQVSRKEVVTGNGSWMRIFYEKNVCRMRVTIVLDLVECSNEESPGSNRNNRRSRVYLP
jgi:hypothetical protein